MAAVAARWSNEAGPSSAPQKPPPPQQQPQADFDRFYGHRALSELCEKVISALFACPLDSTAASAACGSVSSRSGRQAPRLSEFIAYALHRTRLPLAVTHQALFLLRRLKARFPAARGSSGHRLFISALMLASKSSCDDTYSNKSWTIVGQGLFSLREINQMERELFGYLGFKVNVANEDLVAFVALLDADRLEEAVATATPAPKPAPVAITYSSPAASSSPLSSSSSSSYASTAATSTPSTPSRSQCSIPVDVSPQTTSPAYVHPSFAERSRHLSTSGNVSTFNSRASFTGYPNGDVAPQQQGQLQQPYPVYAGSSPYSMTRSVSAEHERSHSSNSAYQQRMRPYNAIPSSSMSMPMSMVQAAQQQQEYQQHAAAAYAMASQQQAYYMSPSAASSSSSFRQSISSGSSFSASPSPSLVGGRLAASTSTSSISSGRTTPDPSTPPTEFGDDESVDMNVADACDDFADAKESQWAAPACNGSIPARYSAHHTYSQRMAGAYDAMHADKLNATAAMLANYNPQWSA